MQTHKIHKTVVTIYPYMLQPFPAISRRNTPRFIECSPLKWPSMAETRRDKY